MVKFQRTKDKSKKGPAITSSGRLMDPELASEWFHMVPHGSTLNYANRIKPILQTILSKEGSSQLEGIIRQQHFICLQHMRHILLTS